MADDKIRVGRISFSGANPMRLDTSSSETPTLSPDQEAFLDTVALTVQAYLKAARDLLTGKYSHLRGMAPEHLAERGNVLVACCTDGIVIRHEKALDVPKTAVGWMADDLISSTAILSQNIVRCRTQGEADPTPPKNGISIHLRTMDPATQKTTEIFSAQVVFDVLITKPPTLSLPPMKPFCLCSIRNNFELGLEGVLVDDGKDLAEGKSMLIRAPMKLPVGWNCIEIFPFSNINRWKPEFAPMWAENDILGAVASHHTREAHFQTLDPQATSRKLYGDLLAEFKELLDSEPDREEELQVFLKKHPALLCPSHTKMWPKLQLGARITDFVFRDATGDYLLIELEKSTHPLFRKEGHPSAELTHAMGQVTDWKRYLEDNLATAQRELGLTGISANPRSMVVIGRSSSLSPENRRKLTTMDSEHPKLRVLTFDDLYDNARAVLENILGPIWPQNGSTKIYYPKGK